MLEIYVPKIELFDEESYKFITRKPQVLKLEHSLISISKWESVYKKPFLGNKTRNAEELMFYIKCMCLTSNVEDFVFYNIPGVELEKITDYIDDTRTATWFAKTNDSAPSGEIITSELIYYWMVAFNIPFECEKWHLNRLMTLIRICIAKNNPKKMSKNEILARNRALNEQRKAQLHTNG